MKNNKNEIINQCDFDDDAPFNQDLSFEETLELTVKFFECEDKKKALKLLNKLADNKQGEIKWTELQA